MFGVETDGLRSRFLDEVPAELLDGPPERDHLRVVPLGAHARGMGAPGATGLPGHDAETWASARIVQARTSNAFRLGEDVIHAAFGEGVVTGVEPDGVIVVRFAGDGSERKLMAEYAPVSRR